MKSGEPHKKNGREMGEITKGGPWRGACGWGAGGQGRPPLQCLSGMRPVGAGDSAGPLLIGDSGRGCLPLHTVEILERVRQSPVPESICP